MSNHVTKIAACQTCGQGLEYLDVKDPYWRHEDSADLSKPHPAIPDPDTIRDL